MRKFSSLLVLSSVILLASCQQTPAPAPLPDTTAPSVVLDVAPGTVDDAGTVTLKATASDNTAVTQVSFYRGSTLISTDTTAPYEAADTVNSQAARSLTYRAVAVDAAGNQGEDTADLTVTLNSVTGTVQEGRFTAQADGSITLATSPWTGGAGVVTLEGYDPQSGREVRLSSGTLAAGGQFTLALPAVDAALLQPINPQTNECQGALTVSDPTAKSTAAQVYVDAEKDGWVTPIGQVSATDTTTTAALGILVYADRAVTINGEQKCGTYTFSYDNVRLYPGWNKVQETEVSSETALKVTYSSATWPTNWTYLNPSATGMKAQGLSLPTGKSRFLR